ncbi:putative bifunctional diguanylate cyclase/phosphodiesterase [Oharaeibacter diazotrophicus]|uniref:Diguanylate cyclase/phosphodiesterase n=1 Tax=Oharaeibacter diazotrophicus TaxID=1920512 RepID=A0A4R6RM33_9HYPH|nr:EAL domain-containing protein [Oharaeibacter diazotrophicus]TDP87614.1 diguanylate cyclase/phosphodiesterase [Oharaeibacter diazotrophicus]BBE70442.1 cyclic di-GMP phosphodiesterase Gmr [Pleomorphomonas sp. SM30]
MTDEAALGVVPERVEQAKAAVRSVREIAPLALVIGGAVFLLLADAIALPVLGGWYALLAATYAVRWGVIDHARRSLERDPERVLRLAVVMATISGLAWAVVPWLVVSRGDLDLRGLATIMVLFSLAASVVTVNTAYAPVTIFFATPCTLSLVAALFTLGDPDVWILDVAILTYGAVLVRSALVGERRYVEHFRLALAQEAASRSLSVAAGELERSNERLVHLVDHDPLTGLLNRSGFANDLDDRIARAALRGGKVALLLIDLDNFKAVNDSQGHPAGDTALAETAARILALVPAGASVSRTGGDEFAVALGDDEAGTVADGLAQRLIHHMAEPFSVAGQPVVLGCSVGIAVYPDHGGDRQSLVSHADMALYSAKDAGKGRPCHFDIDMLSRRHAQRVVEHDLPTAMDRHEVEVHFQPQVSLVDGRLVGVEALVRWHHPLMGWIDPPAIVDAARRVYSAARLTAYVLEASVAVRGLLAAHGWRDIRVAVNVSPRDLPFFPLPELVAEIAGDAVGRVDGIEIEITEDAMIDLDLCGPKLAALRLMGVKIAVDDFGTGFSSLAYMSRLEVDRIKIDRQFVHDLDGDGHNRSLVQAVVGLGRSLGCEVLAEGVETAAMAARLAELGCDSGQGWYFGRAMRADELDRWLADFAAAAPRRSRA